MARDRSNPTRRAALKGLGATALISAAACGKPDPDSPEDKRTLEELIREHVDTVVVVMLENRSFDHYFGARSLEEGDDEVDGLTAEMSNPHPDGSDVFPFRAETLCLSDPPHSWTSSHEQFNGGANDGFVDRYAVGHPTTAEEVMGYWTREMLTAHYTLADAYTLCDRWFCSLMTSTWPNRFYSHAGQNGGLTGNDLSTTAYPSIYASLEAGGHSWGSYFSNLPFTLLLPDRALPQPKIQTIENFWSHAEAGTLPNVTVVEPMYGWNDDHPPNHPKAAQVFLASVYEALVRSPQWERTVLLVTYDEHGGFFDHVPPPTTSDERAEEGFDQLGFRVPSMVIGPWVKPGHVSHEVYEHCSMLALIERIFDLEALTQRDAVANPLFDCFDEEALRAGAPHAAVQLDPIEANDAELFADECVDDPIFATPAAMAASRSIGQEELAQHADLHWTGTRFDRRPDSLAIYQGLLDHAERLGVLRRGDL